jgi:hypothetical protein
MREKMSRFTPRKTGIPMAMFNQTELNDAVRRVIAAQMGSEINEGFEALDCGLLAVKNDKVAVVCGEGVGYIEDDYGMVKVPFVNGRYGGFIDTIEISARYAKRLLSGESQELADFIRVFGDRLENNFWIWAGEAEAVQLA